MQVSAGVHLLLPAVPYNQHLQGSSSKRLRFWLQCGSSVARKCNRYFDALLAPGTGPDGLKCVIAPVALYINFVVHNTLDNTAVVLDPQCPQMVRRDQNREKTKKHKGGDSQV